MAKANSKEQIALDRVCREDLLLFFNAGLTATGQGGYYHGAEKTRLSLAFLHEYICVNYRKLYALCLASGLNHHNVSHGIFRLLKSGAPTDLQERQTENRILAQLIDSLPPQRAYRLIEKLARKRVNNRRTRALVKRFLSHRRDLSFDAVKYRLRFRQALLHSHYRVPAEQARFAFEGARGKPYQTELLETYRQAHYDSSAIYRLPFTVASGLAHKKGLNRETFMEKIQPRMTEREKLRHQRSGARSFDSDKLDLVELCSYFLDCQNKERSELQPILWQKAKAQAARQSLPEKFQNCHIASVLDRSRSSFGVRQRKRHPLAVTLAMHLMLENCAHQYSSFWTAATDSLQVLHPRGYTDLGHPLMLALEAQPDLIVVVSDGRENAPSGVCEALAKVVKQKLPKAPLFLHLNPVYDPDDFMPKSLGESWPVVGVAKATDLSLALAVADFSGGDCGSRELQNFLEKRTGIT